MSENASKPHTEGSLPRSLKFVIGVFALIGFLFLWRTMHLADPHGKIVMLGLGGAFIIIALGLFKRQRWARWSALVTLVLASLIHIATMYAVFFQPVLTAQTNRVDGNAFIAMLCVFIVFLCCLYILWRRAVKAVFYGSNSSS